jgi:hypothetical protein
MCRFEAGWRAVYRVTGEPPQRYCWLHDPANAEKRRRSASKATKSKPSREFKDLKRQLEALAADVLVGKLRPPRKIRPRTSRLAAPLRRQ